MSSSGDNVEESVVSSESDGEVREEGLDEEIFDVENVDEDEEGSQSIEARSRNKKNVTVPDIDTSSSMKHPFNIDFDGEPGRENSPTPTTPLTMAHRLQRHQEPEQVGYPPDGEEEHSENSNTFRLFSGKCEIPKFILVYVFYFFGLVSDTFFLYHFWNVHVRIIRDTFYYNLVDTGFNILSLSAVFAFMFPLLIVLCIPSSCFCCGSRGYYCDCIIHVLSWLLLSLTRIENIDLRLTCQCIFFVCYFYKFVLQLGSASRHHSIRYVRFKHANILSFLYIACLRFSFVGYNPFYISGWVAGLTIFFGFLCLVYLFFEETFSICFPKTWSQLNEECYDESIHLPNEIYEHIMPSKSFSSRVLGIVFSKISRRDSDSIVQKSKEELLNDTKKSRFNNSDNLDFSCLSLYFFETVIGFFQIISLIVLAAGYGSTLQYLTHFALPPLSLPVWADRISFWDGAYVIFFLLIGFILVMCGRTYIGKDEFQSLIEEEFESDNPGEIIEEEEENNRKGRKKRRKWKLNGITISNFCCSPCIFISFILIISIFFGLVSYALDFDFVFWSGCVLVMCIPALFEFFINESIHLQFYLVTDLTDILSYLFDSILWILKPGKKENTKSRKKRLYVFRGPGMMVSCGYVFFVILILSSIGVWSYHFFPVVGDIFGGRIYLVMALTIFFLLMSMGSVLMNRCLLLMRYRLYADSDEYQCISPQCCSFIFKSIFVPNAIEYEIYKNIFLQKCRMKKMRKEVMDVDDSIENSIRITTTRKMISSPETEMKDLVRHSQSVFDDSIDLFDIESKNDEQKEDLEEGGESSFEEEDLTSEDGMAQAPEQQVIDETTRISTSSHKNYDDESTNKFNILGIIRGCFQSFDSEDSCLFISKSYTFLCESFFGSLMFGSLPRFFRCSQIVILIPAFIFLFIGLMAVPTPLDDGESYHSGFYRIAAYNIYHGFKVNGMDNGPVIVEEFFKKQKIDFCGLCETCTARPEGGFQDIVKYYGMMSRYKHSIQGKESRDSTIGVGLVTRLPLGEVQDESFKKEEWGLNRMFLYSTVEINGTVVHFIVTHYDLKKKIQTSQSNQIIQFLSDEGLLKSDVPIVVMGDFNSLHNDTSIETFLGNGFRDSYFEVNGRHDFTYRSRDETREEGTCIDFVFVRGSQIGLVDAFIIRFEDEGINRPSDHYPVVVDITVSQK